MPRPAWSWTASTSTLARAIDERPKLSQPLRNNMICPLCKCPYCGSIVGFDSDDHTVVFDPGADQHQPCPHLAYAAWSISHWELDFAGSSRAAYSSSGDWRCPGLVASVDEHPTAYLDD